MMTSTMATNGHERPRRTRTSESALRITLAALRDAGLSVDKVCITGGQVEIHCGHVAVKPTAKKDEGLKQW